MKDSNTTNDLPTPICSGWRKRAELMSMYAGAISCLVLFLFPNPWSWAATILSVAFLCGLTAYRRYLGEDLISTERLDGQLRSNQSAEIDRLERENTNLREALVLAARWGVSSDGYSAVVANDLRRWIISDMKGPAPKEPEYYAKEGGR